ncbi:MAG: gluconokinase [Chitinophagaceae bacterium]
MQPPIIYIMGVAGCGKSTIGIRLSEATDIPFFDADDFHPLANKEKMKAGNPLNDSDREDWLKTINKLAKENSQKSGAIIACSALKEKYREQLLEGIKSTVHWVLLQGSFKLIEERMKARKNHFMPTGLLQSQFEALETPPYALVINIRNDPDEMVARIIKKLSLKG